MAGSSTKDAVAMIFALKKRKQQKRKHRKAKKAVESPGKESNAFTSSVA